MFHASPQLLVTNRGHLLCNATNHHLRGYYPTVSTIRRDTYHFTGLEGTSPLGDAKRQYLPAICTSLEDQTPGIPLKQEGACYFVSLFGLEIALGFVYVLYKK
jgi:hypothetical protein